MTTLADSAEVVIGVDTHKHTHTACGSHSEVWWSSWGGGAF